MDNLLNTPSVNTPSQTQKKDVPYSTKVAFQNWGNRAAGKPEIDISIPQEDQEIYDFMDRYYPNYEEENAKSAYGYGDFLNNKTSNYNERINDFHKTHSDTLRNELKRRHPDWTDKDLDEKTSSLYGTWSSTKVMGTTPQEHKEWAVQDRERANKQMHDDVQKARKSLMNAKGYGSPEDHARWSKEYYDQELKDAVDRRNSLFNIQKTIENTGKSEMENFTDSLNDYMSKNKKGRDDIPVTTRR